MMRTRKLIPATLATLGLLTGGFLSQGPAAQAAEGHFLISSFGSGLGPFENTRRGGLVDNVQSIAVDATGDVYVYDTDVSNHPGGAIYKYNAAGRPVPFTGLESNVLVGIRGSNSFEVGAEQIAVDNSTGSPNKGDLYVADNSELHVYDSVTGLSLDQGEPLGGGEICGVAVDAAGEVYVGVYPSTVRRYKPLSNPANS